MQKERSSAPRNRLICILPPKNCPSPHFVRYVSIPLRGSVDFGRGKRPPRTHSLSEATLRVVKFKSTPIKRGPHIPTMTSHNPSARLHDKVAIVTGAASGFGLAIAHLFASHGCSIVAADLNGEGLQSHFPGDSSRQPASARVDGRIVGVIANVAERADWDRLVKTARERFGGLDIVVNNAGTSYRNKVRTFGNST